MFCSNTILRTRPFEQIQIPAGTAPAEEELISWRAFKHAYGANVPDLLP